jgi:hypothetical protein
MFAPLSIAFLVLFSAAAEKKVAMVLSVQGPVTIATEGREPRPTKVMDLLSDKDRLTVAADGAATLIFLGDNHRERIKPGVQVTVGSDGCTPPEAVERGQSLAASVAYRDVHRLSGTGQGAAVVLRDPGPPDQSAAVTPMFGSTVLTDRPTLSWRAERKNASYRVRFMSGRLDTARGKEQTLWTARTKEMHLAYPVKEKPLWYGNIYSWQVTAGTDDRAEQLIAEGQFSVATRGEVAEMAPVQKLAASEEPADLLLAALAYQDYGVYDEALSLFERLAHQQPREPRFQFALAYYYARAGRAEEAKKAREQAKELSPAKK